MSAANWTSFTRLFHRSPPLASEIVYTVPFDLYARNWTSQTPPWHYHPIIFCKLWGGQGSVGLTWSGCTILSGHVTWGGVRQDPVGGFTGSPVGKVARSGRLVWGEMANNCRILIFTLANTNYRQGKDKADVALCSKFSHWLCPSLTSLARF